MHRYVPASLLFISCLWIHIVSNAQTNTDSLRSMAGSHQKLGGREYGAGDAAKAIENFTKAHDLYLQLHDLKKAATCLHSIAFSYDELLHDNTHALEFAEKSLPLHNQTNDTLELGNMYKYIGMLKGRLGRYSEAKSDVRKAISHFRSKNYAPGIAVSHYDMALVFVAEQKSDSALHYMLRSKNYWTDVANSPRIFNVNNSLFWVYYNNKQAPEAAAILQENEHILDSTGIFYKDRLEHYGNSLRYYADMRNDAMVMRYTFRQTMLKDSLHAKGINIR